MMSPNNPLAEGAVLHPLTTEYLQRELASYVLNRILDRLRHQTAPSEGRHCMRVTTLPEAVMQRVVSALAEDHADSVQAVLLLGHKQTADETWQVSATRLIELRNASDGRPLIAFIPPGLKAAAEDSFDVSTFVEIGMRDLPKVIADGILDGVARDIVDYVGKKKPIDSEARMRFALSLQLNHHPKAPLEAWAGAALYQLELIPDFELLSGDWQQRIDRNVAALKTLQESTLPLRGRIHNLKLEEGTLQKPLHEFLADQRLHDVRGWGERIATDRQARALAFDRWEFHGEVESENVQIVLDDLDLPPQSKLNGADPNLLYFDVHRDTAFQVKWETDPKPLIAQERGLDYFRVQLVEASGEPVWQSKNIKVGTSTRAARSFKVAKKDIVDLIEDGVYYVRVCAYDASGEDITTSEPRDPDQPNGKHSNESEDIYFWVDPDGEPPPAEPQRSTRVSGSVEAQLYAQGAALARGNDPFAVRPQTGRTGWLSDKKAKRQEAVYNIVYDAQMRYTVSISALLRRVESEYILASPESLGRYHLDLASSVPDRAEPKLRSNPPSAPRSFRNARAELFKAVCGDDGLGIVALSDLVSIEKLILRYAETYLEWLREASSEALDLDAVEVVLPTDDRHPVTVLMMAPTHPLRLLWQLQRARLAAHWVQRALDEQMPKALSFRGETPATFLFKRLLPLNLPPLLWNNGVAFLEIEPLTPFWGAYCATGERDIRAVRQRLASLLGLPDDALTVEEESEALSRKLVRYLEIHPYITTLTLNAFNVGDGAALVESILEIERWRSNRPNPLPELRYRLQLFSHDASQLSVVGRAVELLVNPERQVSDEADVFTVRSSNPLFPKLRYSRNTFEDFRRAPERFEADITLAYDLFRPSIGFAPVQPWRSSFVYGLVQTPNEVFEDSGEESRFVWRQYVAAAPTKRFDAGSDLGSATAELLEEVARAQAQAGDAGEGARPVVTLDLTVNEMSLIQQMHSLSNWVITVDRYLGVDYLDGLPLTTRPVYLLDYVPTLDSQRHNRLLVSTRFVDAAIEHIELPRQFEKVAIPSSNELKARMFERLRQISGRLAFKALPSNSSNQETRLFAIALTDLLLERHHLLEQALVIPIDAHPDLFGHEDRQGLVQPMLLMVEGDIDARRLNLTLVNMHWFESAPRPLDWEARRESMKEQFELVWSPVATCFSPNHRALDYVVQQKRLITLLTHYLERARRFHRMTPGHADSLRTFIETLDEPFDLYMSAMGVLFDPHNPGRMAQESVHTELVYVTIYADEIQALLDGTPLEDLPPAHEPHFSPTSPPAYEEPAFEELPSEAPSELAEPMNLTDDSEPAAQPATTEATADVPDETAYDILLGGDDRTTPQYGLIGMTASGGKKIAIDLNTTNTICLFGAQGSGKSYTVGSIAEMATQAFPAINALPAPLATVIFHYHESQDYPPEFVSMIGPNRAQSDLAHLVGYYGAGAGSLEDIMLLTPIDKVEERRAEFPGIAVEPILFSSAELSIDSWRFLMGTSGAKTVYEKAITQIMRQIRSDIRFETLSDQVDASALSPQQKNSARLRLSFASQFIDDSRQLGQVIQPGRLVIVDLRDELIDKQEALGLFVVMLKIFADAGKGSFNKLVVFDEAHKYMSDDGLSESILSAIRQMRHQGVSLLIASQDPASLPNAIIELASMVVMHRFNAPSWLSHMRKSITALKQLDAAKLAKLKSGEAYVWAARSTDPRWTEEARLVQMRPRVTAHGGGTKTAV